MDTVQSAKEHHFDNGLVLNSHEARISRPCPEMMAALLRNSTGELPQMKAAGSASQAKAQRRGAMLRIRLCKTFKNSEARALVQAASLRVLSAAASRRQHST